MKNIIINLIQFNTVALFILNGRRVSFGTIMLLFALNILEANDAYTLWGKRTAFTRSAITPPNMNRFG